MAEESDAALVERVRRAEQLVYRGHYDDAAEELQVLLGTGERCPRRQLVLTLAAQIMMARGELGAAQETLIEAREAAVQAGDEVGQLQALGTLGQVLRRDGEVEGALQVARDGEILARQMGEVASESTFAADESRALTMLGDGEGALAAARRALEIAGNVTNPIQRLRNAGWLANLLAEAGQLDEARAIADDGLARSRETSDAYGEASFLHTLADVADRQGRSEDALEARRTSMNVQVRSSQWGLLVSSAQLFVVDLGRSPGGYPYLWLAARSMTLTAMLCGNEVRPNAMLLAVHAIADGIRLSPYDAAVEGMDMVCALIRPIDAPDDYPGAPTALEAAVTLVARWMFGHPLDDFPVSATQLDEALGTTPTLATLVSEPSPGAGRG